MINYHREFLYWLLTQKTCEQYDNIRLLYYTDVFTGRCRSVHAYLERIPIENVPEDEQKIRDFLFTQFNKKEEFVFVKITLHTWMTWLNNGQ